MLFPAEVTIKSEFVLCSVIFVYVRRLGLHISKRMSLSSDFVPVILFIQQFSITLIFSLYFFL